MTSSLHLEILTCLHCYIFSSSFNSSNIHDVLHYPSPFSLLLREFPYAVRWEMLVLHLPFSISGWWKEWNGTSHLLSKWFLWVKTTVSHLPLTFFVFLPSPSALRDHLPPPDNANHLPSPRWEIVQYFLISRLPPGRWAKFGPSPVSLVGVPPINNK